MSRCSKCRGSGINTCGLLCGCVDIRKGSSSTPALDGVLFTDADGRSVQIEDMDEDTLLGAIRGIESKWCRWRLDHDAGGESAKRQAPRSIWYYAKLCAAARARGVDPFEQEEITAEIETYRRRAGMTEIK